MRRGEVRWYRFAAPDKRRPVVVLSRDSIIASLNTVTVAPVSSRIRDIPSETPLSRDDGMPRECAVNCDHLQTVDKTKLGSVITTLSREQMQNVAAATCFALDLR